MNLNKINGYKILDQFGLYFVTFTIVGWVDLFTRKECKEIITSSLNYCVEQKGLNIHAYVIMGSHIHLILSASPESKGLSSIIRDFKTFTSKELIRWFQNNLKESRRDWLDVVFKYHAKYNERNSTYQIWMQNNKPKFCEHPKFTINKINYIHNNPVVAGIVNKAEHYIFSSASDYLGISNEKVSVKIIDYGVQEGYVFL